MRRIHIMNPLARLNALGQSVWLDLLSRKLVRSGDLQNLIRNDRISGVTSNPAIFEKAIGETSDYDDDVLRLAQRESAEAIYRELSIGDIKEAARDLYPVYESTRGNDGFVSLEVSPLIAHDTQATIAEAKELWRLVDRSNVMIKIPATAEGLGAIENCIAEGININITLLFGLTRYRAVAEAYIRGLERRIARGQSVTAIRSVASFFLSRIDVLLDERLKTRAPDLKGQAAIASAKLAYQIFKDVFHGDRFQKARNAGAAVQRLLWASTGTKNPEYSDVKYVEPLIGPDTINTMPPQTIDAYRDHGHPEVRIEQGVAESHATMQRLSELGIDMEEVSRTLENEGIEKFIEPFHKMIRALSEKTLAGTRVRRG